MLVHELAPRECAALLQRTTLGRLACAHHDQPYVVPVFLSFDAHRHCLYGFSAIGQKVEWMRQNPKVCVEVEDIEDRTHWTTVVVMGRYEEIHENPGEAEARHRAERLFGERHEWWLPGAAKVDSKPRQHAVMFRIAIDQMTGRRADRRDHRAWF
jgi:nitroimidazol reductase NimA-like FMN-containing flavoprotein (pyridoxamine 5'-phosphate oxidase superfamily)